VSSRYRWRLAPQDSGAEHVAAREISRRPVRAASRIFARGQPQTRSKPLACDGPHRGLFQRPHARALAGPAGTVRAGRVQVPVLLVHGRGDDVAPAADAEKLASELRARDSRHEGLFFDGVGHYLSAPEALAEALQTELAFYRRCLI
jgi:pimeloyl-ACP methyl ester carboxylesterase